MTNASQSIEAHKYLPLTIYNAKSEFFRLSNVGGNQKVKFSWKYVVQEFTSRNLTFESDTLPALSGLAMAIANVTGQKYVGRLWEDELPASLM